MKKPLIGVVPLYDEQRESYWMLPGYMKAIENAGGLPFMLPLTEETQTLEQAADVCGGFLLTGGQDVNPKLYGEPKNELCGEICSLRDTMETYLLKMILERDKSVFGICRGIQLLNVFFGGTLYQDIPSQLLSDITLVHQQKLPYHEPSHTVTLVSDSPLGELLQVKDLAVNSSHHQGIKHLAPALCSAAQSPDGLIEAVYHREKHFVAAVQWHPECSWQTDSASRKIFAWFVESCE